MGQKNTFDLKKDLSMRPQFVLPLKELVWYRSTLLSESLVTYVSKQWWIGPWLSCRMDTVYQIHVSTCFHLVVVLFQPWVGASSLLVLVHLHLHLPGPLIHFNTWAEKDSCHVRSIISNKHGGRKHCSDGRQASAVLWVMNYDKDQSNGRKLNGPLGNHQQTE